MGSESEYIAFTTSLSETFKINGKESILCPFCVFMMKLLREFHIVSSTMRLCYKCMSASTGWTSNFRLSFKKWSSCCFKFYGLFHSFNFSCVGNSFFWNWIPKDFSSSRKEKGSCCLAFAFSIDEFLDVSSRTSATTQNKCTKRHDRRSLKVFTLRSPKVNTLRIKLYRAIL